MVMIEHFGGQLAGLFAGGYYGVDLFFVISGYLITSILIKGAEESFATSYRTFMGRRALRIFPPYYLLLIILLAINMEPARELFPWLATYTFNYAASLYKAAGSENPLYYLWSLSVEEQFYLVWPPIVLLLRKHRVRMIALTAVIVLTGYSQLVFDIVPAMSQFNYTGLFNRMGSLGIGAFGAAWVVWRPLPRELFTSRLVEAAILTLLAAALVWPSRRTTPILGICSLFLVLKAVHFDFRIGIINRVLAHPWTVYVGGISYGIYLFHVPTGLLFTQYVFDPFWSLVPFESLGALARVEWHSWIIKLPLYAALSIAIAGASYRWFEKPVLGLKDRWFRYG